MSSTSRVHPERQALLTEIIGTSGILSLLKNVLGQPEGDNA